MNSQDLNTDQHDPVSNQSNSAPTPPDPNTQLYGKSTEKVQPKPNIVTPKYKKVGGGRYEGLIGIAQIAVGAILAALFINTLIFQSYQVVGESMHPTLSDGDRLIINKMGKTWDSIFRNDHIPKRGDIIIFTDPGKPDRQLVKRVIGIPGDTVSIEKGVIIITNSDSPEGFNPDDSYADSLAIDTNYTLSTEVAEDSLFVAGDNRIGGASFDSRNDLGLVPLENVVGELVLRLLPLDESRFF